MQRRGGFTLIELLIVVVILGILATIAFPSYQRYVDRSHQLAAQQFMLDSLSRAEEWRLDRRSYPATGAELGLDVPDDVALRFTITAEGAGALFTITADPVDPNRQPQMTLRSDGVRTPQGVW